MTRPGAKPAGRAYSGIAPAERARRRHCALLDSALEQFGTHGYAAVSIKQICRGAGVTERHFYESFPNREACLATLYDDLTSGMRTTTRAAIENAGPELDALTTAGLEAFIAYLSSDPRRARVAFIEVVGVSAEMEQRRHRVLSEFATIVTTAWSAYGNRPLDEHDRLIVTALVGGVNHLLVDWLMNQCRDTPTDLVTVCADLFEAARTHRDPTASRPPPTTHI